MSERLEVLNPVADTIARPSGTVPWPKDLANKRVGLYWNSKNNGDTALLRIGEHIGKRYPGAVCDLIQSNVAGVKEKLEQARRYDLVLGATGD